MTKDRKNTDEMKGRVKEAAGDLSGDEDLQREGKLDEAVGSAKDAVDAAAEKAKGMLRKDDEGR